MSDFEIEEVERLREEVAALRRENFDLCAQLATKTVLVKTLEDVLKEMDKSGAPS